MQPICLFALRQSRSAAQLGTLGRMPKLEIYHGGGSPFVWRVLACMEEKGLKYAVKLLDISKRERLLQKVSSCYTDSMRLLEDRSCVRYVSHQAMSVC